ncbi:DnaB-like helicase C-terminal domain-containing protein [Streptomyces sp. N35]|uniref:DnaB-like helicase C-terminal domain-containing protein n=1 Tax=Streptomyces sp. N35 TaxID=2795730 RepID=UPI0018F2B527|nr:DnaB-like helicase C-terminal domain-containing protein [Streptomyces sp. N35]
MTSERKPARPDGTEGTPKRQLATLGDTITGALTSRPARGVSFGLAALDAATGGLQPGRLHLVAAEPNVGGSLLGLAAARHTALVAGRPVLYAASGPNRDDIMRRILAAETGGDYPRLKQGQLTEYEQQVAQQLAHAPLLIDDGSDLTAEAIADTAPSVGDLALVVVDRLQVAPSTRLPLSGPQLPGATQVLAALARTLSIPVLAIVDSDDSAILHRLDADLVLTVTQAPGPAKARVDVAERDFGTIGSAFLRPELLHARFTDASETRATELAEAALPYTSGAQQGLPAAATHVLAALRKAVEQDDTAVEELTDELVAVFSAVTALPDTPEGQRLGAALRSYAPALSANSPALQTAPTTNGPDAPPPEQPSEPSAPAPTPSPTGTATRVEEDADDEQDDAWVQPGDEDEPEGTVFPGLNILKDCMKRSKFHPLPVIAKKERDAEPWTLFREVMAGEPRWVHPDVTVEKRKRGRQEKGDKSDRLIVPASLGDGLQCVIDRNGSYPSACSDVPLAPNVLQHTGPLDEVTRKHAGAFQITVPTWRNPKMPHPLGRLAAEADDQGRVWASTPHVRLLQRLINSGFITEPLIVHDSWTGVANGSLFKPFYLKAREARTELIDAAGEPYKEYKYRVSVALRLLWPKGANSPFWRPDWRIALVAEASVRHWIAAHQAVQDGHTLIALRNVDEAVFWTRTGEAPGNYTVGTGFGDVKVKTAGGEA